MPHYGPMGPGTRMLGGNMNDYCYYGTLRMKSLGPDEGVVNVEYARIWGSADGHWTGEAAIHGELPEGLKRMLGGRVTVTTGDAASGTATATGDLVDGVWVVQLKGVRTAS